MRRTLAAAILGISLWFGSLAWSGFIVNRTVLDPGRSRDVADALYDDDAVRDQLVQNVADALAAAVPDGVTVERAVLEQAAATAIESPAVETLFVDAFVRTHEAFLGEGQAPDELDAGAFGVEARQALVTARPDLDGVLPESPELVVPLPTDRVPNLGPLRDVIDTAVPLLAGLAVAGSLLALGVTSNRPAIIRRAGFWAVGLSAAVLAFAYGIPWLAERFAPDQSQVVAALVGALAASTKAPAATLAVAGLAGIAASFAWRAVPSVAGAAAGALAGDPAAPGAAPAPGVPRRTPVLQRRDVPTPYRRGAASPAGTSAAPATRPRPPDPDGYAARPVAPPPDPHPGYPSAPPPDPTRVVDATRVDAPAPPAPDAAATASAAPSIGRDDVDARFVEGVGWVLEASSDIPDDARWVPGVGYVIDKD